ncbi:MAG: acyclic terpene utilization AtuA family protein [Parachlamydiaceae bacterium]
MTLKIANASAFWGDTPGASEQLLSRAPDIDFITYDYLAEVSLSIMAIQREKDPSEGYAKDFIQVVKSLLPYWKKGLKFKLISNAGGLNPLALAEQIKPLIYPKKCFVVLGDDVFDQMKTDPKKDSFKNLDNGKNFEEVAQKAVTANAYLGASSIVEALKQGADVVITGRVADPSLTVAPCIYRFGWAEDDYQKIAQATIAGHLIECGTQVTGGISTDWMSIKGSQPIGFPIVEVESDGTFSVTKAPGTGGKVTLTTVKEQLIYEIGDPASYLSPDAKVSFMNVGLEQKGDDRVEVKGAIGGAPTPFYKVSATYRAGYKAEGMIALYGDHLPEKARLAGELVLEKVKDAGYEWNSSRIELIGAGAMAHAEVPDIREGMLRIALRSSSKEALERFSQEMASLVTCGPAGTTGASSGRPTVRPAFGFWPCLIERSEVKTLVKEV